MGATHQWWLLSFCLCVHLSPSVTPSECRPWNSQLCHYITFTDGYGGAQFICCCETLIAHQSIHPADVSLHCSGSETTLQFVKECYSSCFIFFDPSFHHQIALTATAASPYTWSKCWWIQDGSSPLATKTLPLLVVSTVIQSLTL